MQRHLPRITFILLALFLVVLLTRGLGETTRMLIVGSLAMFACCWASAIHLLGARAALHFVLIAVSVGWFAEQMGSSYGWFFGHYTYTEVLGWRLGDVPMVIPLMWFALTYIAYVIANLMVWQTPTDGAAPLGQSIVQSFLAAMIVTAYDLGADPYMVFTLKAWIMHKTDGWWFGETLQGFVGWMAVSFVIIFLFRLTLRRRLPVAAGGCRQCVSRAYARAARHLWRQHAVPGLPRHPGRNPHHRPVRNGHPVAGRPVRLEPLAGTRHRRRARRRGQPGGGRRPHGRRRTGGMMGTMHDPVVSADPRYRADPPADDTVARILAGLDGAARYDAIAVVNREIAAWTTNGVLDGWRASPGTPAHIAAALEAFVHAARVLPDWADPAHRRGGGGVRRDEHAVLHPAVLRQPARVLRAGRPGQRAAHGRPARTAHRLPRALDRRHDLPGDAARRLNYP